VSDRLDKAVQALTRGLEAALGDRLASLVLYGSVARGTHVPGRSDANVLLIVTDAGAAVLRLAAPPLAAWSRAGYPPPLIHTPAEWAAAADVYPLEVEDIREAHRVLAGRDPVEGVTTNRGDQLRELEHQARGLLLHLRGRYGALASDPRALAALLSGSVGAVLVFCRAALRLAGQTIPRQPEAVAAEAGVLAGFDEGAFRWAIEARRETKARLEAYDERGSAYLASVERLVGWVDGLEKR